MISLKRCSAAVVRGDMFKTFSAFETYLHTWKLLHILPFRSASDPVTHMGHQTPSEKTCSGHSTPAGY